MAVFKWTMRSSKSLLVKTWIVAILSFLLHATVIGLSITSLVTNHWVEFKVNRDDMLLGAAKSSRIYPTNSSLYFSRNRGIFMTCYPDADAAVFLQSANDVVNDNCILEQGFKMDKRDTNDGDSDDAFVNRTHLLRFMVAMKCLNVIVNLITFISAWFTFGKGQGGRLRKVAGFTFGDCVINAAGMVVFQYIYYLEDQKILYDQFHAGWRVNTAHLLLVDYTKIKYGYSYILGWISFGSSILPPIMYLFVARTLIIRQREENVKLLHRRPQQQQVSRLTKKRPSSTAGDIYYTSSMDRNPAYDFLHKEKKQNDNMTI